MAGVSSILKTGLKNKATSNNVKRKSSKNSRHTRRQTLNNEDNIVYNANNRGRNRSISKNRAAQNQQQYRTDNIKNTNYRENPARPNTKNTKTSGDEGRGLFGWAEDKMNISADGRGGPNFDNGYVKGMYNYINSGSRSDRWKKRGATAGTWMGANLLGRAATGGSLATNAEGEQDIAGIWMI